ncbi:MAG: serine protein kinase PrkA [Desulfamplus sp.]|nr:serine protein kinase PrkA [Desulfamplus sp.]MBF0241332.1 serine protein kinase PrkA [Desulfamplus sp.]MBF0389319.1 serine protein kinase PrkA [Desulfamplus sp.]
MTTQSLGIEYDKTRANEAVELLNVEIGDYERLKPITFKNFLTLVETRPSDMLRNVFQVFHDMMQAHVTVSDDSILNDMDEFSLVDYDCSRLFVEGSENPYFTDRLFANRLMKHMEGLRHGTQQNRIYIFHGPHGCGKSTFLNNLLKKFEAYANTEEGMRYEVVWRLDIETLGGHGRAETVTAIERLVDLIEKSDHKVDNKGGKPNDKTNQMLTEQCIGTGFNASHIEIPCISHDNPILIIPKNHRRKILDKLIKNDEFKWRLFTEKQYDWVFSGSCCTICESIYQSLLERLGEPSRVFEMLHARPYYFNRRLGAGISVFNPGDRPVQQNVITNQMVQNRINNLFRDSNVIHYIYSRFAKTNNGIYALMDIKSHNVERMVELHNIISEAVHKVEDIEESVNSLFLALMNPEDKNNIKEFPSFSDRIQYINIPYVLDINTEVKIYCNIFGRHIEDNFLPMVMENFARIIVSSRLKARSESLMEWIRDASKYRLYCDEQLLLLKMEIYSGSLPEWLDSDDRKALTSKMWRKILAESDTEGNSGFSGRDSIRIFDQFYSRFAREDRLINMPALCSFFRNLMNEMPKMVPDGFLESLLRMYDYNVLQQVKESLYYYNEDQIAKDIKNYISAVNFEIGSSEKCLFTKEMLHVSNSFLESLESRLFAGNFSYARRQEMRQDVLKDYTTNALTREIMIEGKDIADTKLFDDLHEQYINNLKKKVLEPFIDNENFGRAIKDFDTPLFKTYDNRIKTDIEFLISNMVSKFGYTQQGAKEVCIYVIDSNLARKFK